MEPVDLDGAAGPSVERYRIGSLQRMLTEALSRGSVRKVLGTFVEALGVWDDVRVDVYAASAASGFFRYVSPMGALLSSPPTLNDLAIPSDNRMVRCSRTEIDRAGFDPESGDLLILRIPTGDVSWILIFSGAIDDPKQVRLTLYADMLRESLNEVIASTIGRVVGAMTRDPLPPNEPLADAARTVLAQLTAAVGGHESALVVSAPTGRQTLAVGNADLLQDRGERQQLDRLVVTSPDPRSAMTVVMEREQPRFTALDRAIVQAAAAALHPRVQGAIQGSRDGERRRQFRPVDSLFDQLAAEAVGAGQPASVIVVSVNAAALGPGLLYTWLVRIREQLRAGDFAGILSHTEIAVLLSDASADQAAVVAARLKQVLQSDDSAGMFLNPVFRTTTRSPESAFEGSLVGAARAGAASVH